MSNQSTPQGAPKATVRLNLTEEQRAQVKAGTGKDAEALELGVEELEQRIAPFRARLM